MARDIRQALAAQAAKARERFLEAIRKDKAHATESAVLAQCAGANAETEFGKEHRFSSIHDMDAYRAAVPIRDYEELRPWIDRAAEGVPQVLTKDAPTRFWKTTGTTSRPKRIPVTQVSSARVTESWLVVNGTHILHYPEVNERADAMLLTHISPKKLKEQVPSGLPYCSTTEAPLEIRAGQEAFFAPWFLRFQSVVEDDAERLYYLLIYAAVHDLHSIGCLHPSRFQTIVSTIDRERTRLLQEIAEGTVLGEKIREPRPDRARALEAVVARSGTLLPRDIWPNLRFLTSWSGSYIGQHMPLMERAFCKDFIPMPSVSSECFMTTTVDKDRLGQPLNLRGGLFEFINSGETITPNMKTLLFHELQVGGTYEMIITTLGGLYRYAIGDIFRVTDYFEAVPRLEYIARRAVTDLTGEKLADEQVVEVVRAVLGEYAVSSSNFTLCAVRTEGTTRVPRYVLVVEEDGEWSTDRRDALALALDERFKSANSRYELKRNFHDLGRAEVELVARGTFMKYRQLLISRGMPAGQLKDKAVHPIGAPVLADLLKIHQAITAQ